MQNDIKHMSDNTKSEPLISTGESEDIQKIRKRKHKNKLRSNTYDCIKQCISCGIVIEKGDYCEDMSCKFDNIKRSDSISYTRK